MRPSIPHLSRRPALRPHAGALRSLAIALLSALIAESAAASGASPRPRVHPGKPKRADKAPKECVVVFPSGGDDEEEEKYEDSGPGTPIPNLHGWFGFDKTDSMGLGGISDFNADGLQAGGLAAVAGKVPNHAFCFCADTAGPGFATAPGYGNDWNVALDWSAAVPNPFANTTIRLRFRANYDVEPGRDFVRVLADKAAGMTVLNEVTGSNKDPGGAFTTPANFDMTFVLTPADYAGPSNNRAHLRLQVTSDRAGSDEDGLWPTSGAAQIDEIRVDFNGFAVSHADFEGPGGNAGWTRAALPAVGDFTKVLALTQDLDPCRDNFSPALTFIDDGTPPSNFPGQSTGGAISPQWSYGPGGFSVNGDGGIAGPGAALNNEARSPRFAWNAPGAADDALHGATLAFDVWQHLPYENGIFWVWHVRARDAGTAQWGPWRDHGFVYYSPGAPHHETVEIDVSCLMPASPESVQIALGVIDLAATLGLPGQDATPSPMFDNLSFSRCGQTGPAICLADLDLFQDAFPHGGASDFSTPLVSHAVRLDPARDLGLPGAPTVPGDSIAIDVHPVGPGVTLVGVPRLRWLLDASPRYDGVRILPPGAVAIGSGRYRGFVPGVATTTPWGDVIAQRWTFDLPHDGPALFAHQTAEQAMFFPGDVLRWFLEATDSAGHTATVPPDTAGFGSGVGYPRTHTVRALPSVTSVAPGPPTFTQPSLLVVDDSGSAAEAAALQLALAQNGLSAGVDYDSYQVHAPDAGQGNGIGSGGRHGATAAQLAGYRTLIYTSGNLTDFLLSDGTGSGNRDSSLDLQVLAAWHNQAAHRRAVYFGDNLVSFLHSNGATASSYLSNTLKVSLLGSDARQSINDQVAPTLAPTGAGPTVGLFTTTAVAASCVLGDDYDAIAPLGAPAVRAHEWLSPGGAGGAYLLSASVWHGRTQTIGQVWQRVDLTFPTAFASLVDPVGAKVAGASRRALLLGEILRAFDHTTPDSEATDTPPPRGELSVEPARPNPFNPATSIRLHAPSRGRLTARIYSVRGELLDVLLDAEVPAGSIDLLWRGTDRAGREVASGVYLLRVEGFDRAITRKLALLR